MATEASRVLRVPRSDQDLGEDDSATILVNVVRRGSLEFEVAATENSNVYHTKFSKSKVNAAKDQKFKGSEEEWHAIVLWMFCREKVQAEFDLSGLETEATIKTDKELTITVRRNLGEIQPRLGSFSIPVNNDHMIDLFSWGEMAAGARDRAEAILADLEQEKIAHETTIEKLKSQLADFVTEKKKHEDVMLEKFRQLLNTKKLKIRDQQRLLKNAKIDYAAAKSEGDEMVSSSDNGKKPLTDRKRKASATGQLHAPEEDVAMAEVDTDGSEGQPEERPQMTPDHSELEDAETEDEDNAPMIDPSRAHKEERRERSSPAVARRSLPLQAKAQPKKRSSIDDEETDEEL